MYTIIGGDGKEYGPVSAELVRSWIAGGRANMQTRIKGPGGDDWKTIADFPELTAPAAPVGAATSSAAPIGASAPLDVFGCYERSWKLLKANFWPLVGINALFLLIFSVLGYSQFMGVFFVSPLLGAVLSAGMYYYYLKKIRGQPTTVGDLFSGFTKAFFPILIAAIIMMVFVTLGFICLLLPGVYLAVAYSFAYLLILDKGLGFWPGMETSRKVVTRQWWRMFGMLLMSIPFVLLGLVALGVGVLVTLPLITGAFVYAYEDLTGPKA